MQRRRVILIRLHLYLCRSIGYTTRVVHTTLCDSTLPTMYTLTSSGEAEDTLQKEDSAANNTHAHNKSRGWQRRIASKPWSIADRGWNGIKQRYQALEKQTHRYVSFTGSGSLHSYGRRAELQQELHAIPRRMKEMQIEMEEMLNKLESLNQDFLKQSLVGEDWYLFGDLTRTPHSAHGTGALLTVPQC
jgi:hypothetical protein